MATMPEPAEPQFEVALSFASEQRAYVRIVASELDKRNVKAFFDEENQVELWGKNLIEEFQRIYMTASNVVVMFISKEYAEKPWTRHERRSALKTALESRREYILPTRFDDTVLEGLDPNLGYLPLKDFTPEQLAEAIVQKLVRLGGRVEPPKPLFSAREATGPAGATCHVSVNDQQGRPITNATVLLVAPNGTASQATSDGDGIAEVPAAVRRNVAVFVAHPDYRAAYLQRHDSGEHLDVTLPTGNGCHSVIFPHTTGHIPGFRPRLNPIGQGHDADAVPRTTYLYVDNGSVDGRAEQPFFFRVGAAMMLEDSEGRQVRATCVGFVGRSTLWEYQFPEDGSG